MQKRSGEFGTLAGHIRPAACAGDRVDDDRDQIS
jgi:hypothetical protein